MAIIDPAMAYREHPACQLKRGVLLRNRLNFQRDCANFLMSGSRTVSHEGTKDSSCLRVDRSIYGVTLIVIDVHSPGMATCLSSATCSETLCGPGAN